MLDSVVYMALQLFRQVEALQEENRILRKQVRVLTEQVKSLQEQNYAPMRKLNTNLATLAYTLPRIRLGTTTIQTMLEHKQVMTVHLLLLLAERSFSFKLYI